MGIDLAVQSQKLSVFPAYQHLLFLDLILVHRLDQFIGAFHHTVIIADHAADLIPATFHIQRHQMIAVHRFEDLTQLCDPFGKRTVKYLHKPERKQHIYRKQQ